MTRINCHSAFKHYEMFHSGCGGGNNYGSIFNTTYNIDCNGHGGFWGGFGFGLGNAFGGLFSGLFGGGMNFGNFGMGGFGFPSFGNFGLANFGLPSWGGLWGNNNNSRITDKSNNDDGKCKCNENTEKTECNDPDRQKLVDFGEKVNDAITNKDLKPNDLKTLYDQIKKAQNDSKTEGHHDKTDPNDYQNWLDVLKNEAARRGWGDIESADFGKTGTQPTPVTTPTQNQTPTPNPTPVQNQTPNPTPAVNPQGTQNQPVGGAGTAQEQISVNGKPVNINDLTNDQIKGLTKDDISKLTPDQAKQLLEKLGITDGGVVKDVNNISVLRLLEKAGIDVKLAQNTDTTSVIDQWIQGKISGVQEDKDGKISYSVDCTKHGSQKNKYNFVQKDKGSNTYTVTVKEFGQGAKYAKPGTTSVEYTYDASAGHLKRKGFKFTTEH